VNTSKANKIAFSEVMEPISKTVTGIYKLTEAEISQVVGGGEKGGQDGVVQDSVKGPHD